MSLVSSWSSFRMLGVLLIAAVLGGCNSAQKVHPDYNRELPPGASALRLLLDPNEWPDLKEPFQQRDPALLEAADRSLDWYSRPSTSQFFPMRDITHIRAQVSVYAFKKLLKESSTPEDFARAMHENFYCYTSVGWDDRGTMLYTGYYTPVFKGSRTPTVEYKYPLYRRPKDLKIDAVTGKVLGREISPGHYEPYPARAQIENSGMLKGLELVYVSSRFDQYVIQVNGSAKIELPDGSAMYIGYAGNNGHDYTGLGATLLKEGVLTPDKVSLAAIRAYFAGKDDLLEKYIERNERYVFFTEYDGSNWPAGSLNEKVTPFRTIATDKTIFPRGAVVIVATRIAQAAPPAASSNLPRVHKAPAAPDVDDKAAPAPNQKPFEAFMFDQDTGGAIRAAGRTDLYMGIGNDAEHWAGAQFSEGRLYYFFLRHDRLMEWIKRMRQDPTATPHPAAHADHAAVF